MSKKILLFLLAVSGALFAIQEANAGDFVQIDQINYPLTQTYTLSSPNNEITLDVLAESIKEDLTLKMMTIVDKDSIGNFFTLPENQTPATDLYFVKFTPESADTFKDMPSPQLTIRYEAAGRYKEPYFFDWLDLKFVKLDSTRDELNHLIYVKLPARKKIMIALFNEPELLGKVSWYTHPKFSGYYAASRDFSINSKLKVFNFFNNKEVIVTIKDYGPKKCADWTAREQELMGPCQERILDLSKEAFLQLATSTGVGIISQVKVTPVNN